jgi:hypothetical protein
MGWVVNATSRLLYPGKYPVSIVKEAGWASGLIWTGAENLASTGIRSPDRPARSESLYRLSYRGNFRYKLVKKIVVLFKVHGLPLILSTDRSLDPGLRTAVLEVYTISFLDSCWSSCMRICCTVRFIVQY